ncbi:TPA: preprotein translocase subunit SecG [Vibrio parahaemolyticus]|uniref:preprotein translocase subunit SecG n=1 Tax=Vibrio parahaemolyticus TaxID=670 RepID=UPI00079FDBF6|nr:preprotein translocase subunit SecG [Vibrio parahaemolyticus]EJG0409454.1 preprotein translocase subunit SecG [Vibrio parahaemolyticus]EKC5522090.1 preprotein translocase subunit SecG [Vibrio parahaemolyticus]ELB2256595.1 preprotein translocase subunit SecG [Vibrio parahaemolyticus]KYY26804.1 preprotein translocase subunit SecG [Vibrio parahaemolyticus]MCX8876472.1 preprotein translocase subunit SecG [Vibrio parahaemolyticus]
MFSVLLVIYLLAALGVIGLVLIQQGKGADMGASFGAGASNTVFGASGSGNFLTRTTAILATVFFVVSLLLGRMSTHKTESQWVDPTLGQPAVEQVKDAASEVPAPTGDEIPQ